MGNWKCGTKPCDCSPNSSHKSSIYWNETKKNLKRDLLEEKQNINGMRRQELGQNFDFGGQILYWVPVYHKIANQKPRGRMSEL
jgi:hypothetical protein